MAPNRGVQNIHSSISRAYVAQKSLIAFFGFRWPGWMAVFKLFAFVFCMSKVHLIAITSNKNEKEKSKMGIN